MILSPNIQIYLIPYLIPKACEPNVQKRMFAVDISIFFVLTKGKSRRSGY